MPSFAKPREKVPDSFERVDFLGFRSTAHITSSGLFGPFRPQVLASLRTKQITQRFSFLTMMREQKKGLGFDSEGGRVDVSFQTELNLIRRC